MTEHETPQPEPDDRKAGPFLDANGNPFTFADAAGDESMLFHGVLG